MTDEVVNGVDGTEVHAVTIKDYSDTHILVQGDYTTYNKDMRKFNSKWNSRLKVGPGWLIPVIMKEAVHAYFGIPVKVFNKYIKSPKLPKSTKSHEDSDYEERGREERGREERGREERSREERSREERSREERGREERSREERGREEPTDLHASQFVRSERSVRSIVKEADVPTTRRKAPSTEDDEKKLVDMVSKKSMYPFGDHKSSKPVKEDDDIVSLSKKMREIMVRLENIEATRNK